jgi:hypothetical protein
MSDRPLHDAIANIPKNQLEIEADAEKRPGAKVDAGIALTLERERELQNGTRAIGVTAGASTTRGGYVAAFFRRIWR